MPKKVFLILVLTLLRGGMVFAEETLTITTYYPSPYGSYRELAAQKMKVGSTYSTKAAVENSLIVEGAIGIGTDTPNPNAKLDVRGDTIMNGNLTVDDMKINKGIILGGEKKTEWTVCAEGYKEARDITTTEVGGEDSYGSWTKTNSREDTCDGVIPPSINGDRCAPVSIPECINKAAYLCPDVDKSCKDIIGYKWGEKGSTEYSIRDVVCRKATINKSYTVTCKNY